MSSMDVKYLLSLEELRNVDSDEILYSVLRKLIADMNVVNAKRWLIEAMEFKRINND